MKILICEDELIIAEFIKETCHELGYSVLGPVNNVNDALRILKEETVDLALLDINMERKNSGIEIGSFINKNFNIPFIYITAFSDSATLQSAVETNPQSYLIKPIDKSTIQANILLARFKKNTIQESLKKKVIKLSLEHTDLEIVPDELLFIEANDKYCEIYLKDQTKKLVRASLTNLEEVLAGNLIRVHKSYLINPIHITGSSSLKLLIHSHQIPIGRKYRQGYKEFLETLDS